MTIAELCAGLQTPAFAEFGFQNFSYFLCVDVEVVLQVVVQQGAKGIEGGGPSRLSTTANATTTAAPNAPPTASPRHTAPPQDEPYATVAASS